VVVALMLLTLLSACLPACPLRVCKSQAVRFS
jgi:hypothetical protein